MPETRRTLLHSLVIVAVLAAPLSGCDIVQQQMGIENPAAKAARNEAEGRAVGGACRQSGRAIEDCYNLNPGAQRAAVFAGWREMNDYMAEKNIAEVEPKVPPPPPPAAAEEKPAPKPKRSAEAKAPEPPAEDAAQAQAPEESATEPAPARKRRRSSE